MSYEQFAYYYDSLMDPQFYDDYIEFIKKHVHSFYEVLELGCGTSEIAIRLAKEDYKVFATDLSDDMIEVSKQKAMYENVDLMLQKVDMTDFSTSYPVDLILCVCDSLNYVLEENKVKDTFKNVYVSLTNEGSFVFDVNSLYKMNTILNNYVEEADDEEFAFKWEVTSDHNGSVVHKVFIHDKVENDIVNETHYQKTYSVDQYKNWLKECGFNHIEVYSDFDEYNDVCERVIFVCRKG